LERYQKREYNVLRTDLNGAISVIIEGEDVRFETEAKDDKTLM